MTTGIGFRLPFEATTEGVGFVNPFPLPNFAPGLQQLHMLRKSAGFSDFERTSQAPAGMEFGLSQFRDRDIFVSSTSNSFRLPVSGLDYTGGGFTFAFIFDLSQFSFFNTSVANNIFMTSDYTQGGATGSRFQIFNSTSGLDARLEWRVFAPNGRAVSSPNFEFQSDPSTHRFVVLAGWDGDDVFVFAPGWGVDTDSEPNPANPSSPSDEDPDIIFGERSSTSQETDINAGHCAFARWGRGLTPAERTSEHAKLVDWATEFGLENVV